MIYDGYGQMETIILICNRPGLSVKPGSMGKPSPGHEIAIIDAQGKEVPPGIEGEIALRGHPPSLFQCYWKDPELTARSRRGDWYVTGDRAYKDGRGCFWFVGRAESKGWNCGSWKSKRRNQFIPEF